MSCSRGRIIVPSPDRLLGNSVKIYIEAAMKDDISESHQAPSAQPELQARERRRLWLESLPIELLSHIFTFLDTKCPSEVRFNEQPARSLINSDNLDLITMSCVSKSFRLLLLPLLFANARLDPYDLTDFLKFIDANNLAKHVKSVVASLQGPCNHYHPAWWARLLNAVPCQTFTVICAPHNFAELASTSINSVDSWAFNMPFHVVRFRQSPEAAREHISLNHLPNVLTARPWTELSVNEGSSLKAYTTYEYFLRNTPSFMASLHQSKSAAAASMFAKLTSFSFTAIFPFYNHVDEVLKSVRKMKQLRKLSLKLCPEPDSTVLTDEIEEAHGHIDVNDPWNEFDTAYTLVAHTVIFLTVEGLLDELRIDDVKMEGIRDNLELAMTTRLQEGWRYDGGGSWKKKLPVPEQNLGH